MRNIVVSFFPKFSERFEGSVPWMYLDVKGLVTTAIGNLIDPVASALALPWVWKTDGHPASRFEINAEWFAVKNHPTAAKQGHRVLEAGTSLRLTPEGIDQTLRAKMQENYQYLLRRFPEFDEWPAEAQLATLSMAWACGPAFHFARLEESLKEQDFANAATQCHINDVGNPGVTPRNAANVALYETAAHVAFEGLDREILRYQGHEYGAPDVPEPATIEGGTVHPDPYREAYDRLKDTDNE